MNSGSLNKQLKILDSILHGVILTDLRGHIIYWNKANEEILGYRKEEILGKSIRILYDDEMPFKTILRQSFKGKPMSAVGMQIIEWVTGSGLMYALT